MISKLQNFSTSMDELDKVVHRNDMRQTLSENSKNPSRGD